HASRPRRLGPADQPEILEHVARYHRHVANLRPRHTGDRVQVDPQLVRVIQVAGTDRVGIEVYTSQVDDPGQLRGIAYHDLLGGPARWKGELDRLDPFGARRRRAFLEEGLPLGPVDEPLESHGATRDPTQRSFGDRHVIANQIELGVAALREEDLVGIADRDRPAGDFQDLVFRR